MNIDKIDFADALNHSDGNLLKSIVAKSILRQRVPVLDFCDEGDGGINLWGVSQKHIITTNIFGGAKLSFPQSKGLFKIYPRALSLHLPQNITTDALATLITMQEEMVLKRMLDGLPLNETELDIDDQVLRCDRDIEIDETISLVVSKMDKSKRGGNRWNDNNFPLIFFDHLLLFDESDSNGRKFSPDGFRLYDAELTDTNYFMYSFPYLNSQHRRDVEFPDIDPKIQSVYVMEAQDIMMISSDVSLHQIGCENGPIVASWVISFIFLEIDNIHRIYERL